MSLMKELADEVRFEPADDGTVVSLAVDRPSEPAPGPTRSLRR